jgi:hypothetical protein
VDFAKIHGKQREVAHVAASGVGRKAARVFPKKVVGGNLVGSLCRLGMNRRLTGGQLLRDGGGSRHDGNSTP